MSDSVYVISGREISFRRALWTALPTSQRYFTVLYMANKQRAQGSFQFC